MVSRIDINCDLGESFGRYTVGHDAEVMPYISSCNIACGFHAGDPVVMTRTIELALQHNVSIGAHPSYPDLQGFGRRSMQIPTSELADMLVYQIGALKAMVEAQGGRLHHVKPHGALYNDAVRDPEIALSIAHSIRKVDSDLVFLGLAQSTMCAAAESADIAFAHEAFMDRAYQADGSLLPRSKPGAVIKDLDQVIQRVLWLAQEHYTLSAEGERVSVQCDSICLHGDHPQAAVIASQVYASLSAQQIQVQVFE
ncbi:LamB/YcsF family protein [Marinicella sp. W31]|uniref:LamB/YcsF family protein n=1 Tax=Marinicella sp. W31 TaxID=3023713 RepID=UPI0037564277